jgi:hypothetical protein
MKEICIRDGVCAEGVENIEKGLCKYTLSMFFLRPLLSTTCCEEYMRPEAAMEKSRCYVHGSISTRFTPNVLVKCGRYMSLNFDATIQMNLVASCA